MKFFKNLIGRGVSGEMYTLVIKIIIFSCFFCSLSATAQTVLEVGKSNTFSPGDWVSDAQVSDPSIISVSAVTSNSKTTGVKVTALKAGTAVCKISYVKNNSLQQTSYTIEVIDLKSINIPQSVSVKIGNSYKFSPLIQDSRMNDYLLEWYCDDNNIASIDSDKKTPIYNSLGTVTGYNYIRGGNLVAKNPGTTRVICTYKGLSAVSQVTVEPIYVSEVGFDKEEYNLNVYQSLQLQAIVLPLNATNADLTWKSTNTSVAVVNNKGSVTGVNKGKAMIIATSADGSMAMGSCVVNVLPDEKEEFDINFKIDDYIQFSTKVEPQSSFSFNVDSPTPNWKLESFNVNGINAIDQMDNGFYLIENIENPLNIVAKYAYDGQLRFYDLTTSVESTVDNSSIVIAKADNTLNLKNIRIGANIKIYTIGGQLIGTHECHGSSMNIELDSNYYVIMVDNVVFKIRI